MLKQKILILGGTGDARLLADRLVAAGIDVTTSLAGVTKQPVLPVGKLRVGGFGGASGLRAYLLAKRISILIDATHPFAQVISRNAAEAVSDLIIRHITLDRPVWEKQAGDDWIDVPDVSSAAECLPPGARAFLTIGRRGLQTFMDRADLSGVVRCIEPPEIPIGKNWRLTLDRPHQHVDAEKALLKNEAISHLVTKNAGGDSAVSKLIAARKLSLPVVMVARPLKSKGESYESIDQVMKYICEIEK